ncbi:MAG: SDR family oxidoreductase, partial [Actinobacteria bacterium]|nr:SDR family oxidoreductase [Actinomycetota bacterium]
AGNAATRTEREEGPEVSSELQGQVAVVTGSGRGFGRAIAEGLAAAGAAVVVSSRTQSEIDEVTKAIDGAGGQAVGQLADVTKLADIQGLRAAAESKFGPVTLAVHNAGVPWPFGPTWQVDPARWWSAQQVHVLGAMHVINTFVPGMVDRHHGRVVVISSAGGTRVAPYMSGYGVAKNTQIRLMEFLGHEGHEAGGVTAFAVHPGDELTGISDLTMNDPDAQRWVPWFVDHLRTKIGEDGSAGFKACADLVVKLGTGRYDRLSGQYLTPFEDLDARPDSVFEAPSLDPHPD